MESLFVKIVLSGLVFIYLFLYYEELFEFAQLQFYGPDKWQNISKFNNSCTCQGEKELNCYSHRTDESLCGKCFESCHHFQISSSESSKKSETDFAFALAVSHTDVNKLLVLIASIHRNFPMTKLLIFDKDNTTFLQNQLISVRNVNVIRIENPGKVRNNILTPFYLQKSLELHSKVVWLSSSLLEFHNSKLTQFTGFDRTSKTSIVYVSRDKNRKITSYGYRQFFPSTSVSPNFPMAVVMKKSGAQHLKWVQRCALNSECWKCEKSTGLIEDCTWNVLHRIASDRNEIKSVEDFTNSLQKQSWAPPECDFYCAMYLILMTSLVVLAVGGLAILLFKRATTKKIN